MYKFQYYKNLNLPQITITYPYSIVFDPTMAATTKQEVSQKAEAEFVPHDEGLIGTQVPALIILESEEFRLAAAQRRHETFHRQIHTSNPEEADDKHPFIVYKKPGYHRNEYTMDYYRRAYSRWTEDSTRQFWRQVDHINWCFQDIEHSGFNFEAIRRHIHRSMSDDHLVVLCTGYYHYTKVLFKWLEPLFKKYKLTDIEKVAAASHIAMLGKNWYNLMIDDITVIEPIIQNKTYVNFYETLTGSLARSISAYLADGCR